MLNSQMEEFVSDELRWHPKIDNCSVARAASPCLTTAVLIGTNSSVATSFDCAWPSGSRARRAGSTLVARENTR
jgi:hypothetical protein